MFMNIMNNISNMDKNSRFLLIIIGIISFLLVIIFLINFFTGRKEKKQIKRIKQHKKRLIEEINKDAKEIKIEKKNVVPIPKQISVAKEEVEVLEEDEVIEVLTDEKESDVDRILRDIKECSKEESLNLTAFEKEQEETAIISYDELCKRAGVKKKIYKTENVKVEKAISDTTNNKGKYKPSKIVSPIYGIQEEKVLEVIDEDDMDKTFLQSLKEFRSTLD